MEEAVPGVQICASPASWRSDPAASVVGGGGEGGIGGLGGREAGGDADGGGGIGGGRQARAETEARLEASPAEAAEVETAAAVRPRPPPRHGSRSVVRHRASSHPCQIWRPGCRCASPPAPVGSGGRAAVTAAPPLPPLHRER
uniref:Uncharacterized protein n=1 Tax=Oryza nivara TaxID=4536 RepID=A0A0E0FLB9_ORYNI